MMDQSKNIEDTDTEPKIEAKEQSSVQNTKRKLEGWGSPTFMGW